MELACCRDTGSQVFGNYSHNILQAHVGFEKPWQFMVGFRSPSIMNDWTADASLLDYKIRQRTLPNLQGGSSLHFFDGPAMSVYSFPSKGSEVVYCRRKKDSPDCLAGHGFDQEMDSYSVSALDLKQHEETLPSLSVRANKDMRRGSYVGLDAAIHSLTVKPAAIELLGRLKRVFALAPVSRAHMVSKFVTDFGRRPSGNVRHRIGFQVQHSVTISTHLVSQCHETSPLFSKGDCHFNIATCLHQGR